MPLIMKKLLPKAIFYLKQNMAGNSWLCSADNGTSYPGPEELH